MKAIIKKGKYKGEIVKINQWCNDWFTVDPRDNTNLSEKQQIDIIRKPLSPSSLFFTAEGMKEILEHKNNGMLLNWFEPTLNNGRFIFVNGLGLFSHSFKKRRLKS